MKVILILIVINFLLFPQQQKNFHVQKNNQGGFDIFNDSGEIIQEFTESNTDSSTLLKLNVIFHSRDNQPFERQPLAVLILKENEIDWAIIVVAFLGFLGTIGGIFVGNYLSNKSQMKLYFTQQKYQYKKEKLAEFKAKYSSIVGKFMIMNNIISRLIKNEKSTDPMEIDLFNYARNFLINNTQIVEDINKLYSEFNLLLEGNKATHKEIADVIDKITAKMEEYKPIADDLDKLNKLVYLITMQMEADLL